MPNTLAHLGLNGIVTRYSLRDADLRWIYLGAIIPDLPWIMQRIARFLLSDLDPFDLRLYVIVQASLFFSLILSAAFALCSPEPKKTFFILGAGAFLHLFLDAFQIKWANGVHFFAPFDWRLTQFGFFWPESFPTYLVTAFGLGYALFYFRQTLFRPLPLKVNTSKQGVAAILLFIAYVALPVVFMKSVEAEDNHFIHTLKQVHSRSGKAVEFDRVSYHYESGVGVLRISGREELNLTGIELKHDALVSIRGIFIGRHQIKVTEYHVHSVYFRDNASYLGLGLVAVLWGWGGGHFLLSKYHSG